MLKDTGKLLVLTYVGQILSSYTELHQVTIGEDLAPAQQFPQANGLFFGQVM